MTDMWSQKKGTQGLIYEADTDSQTENKLVATEGEGMKWELGITIRTLLAYEQVINKDLLYRAQGAPLCTAS